MDDSTPQGLGRRGLLRTAAIAAGAAAVTPLIGGQPAEAALLTLPVPKTGTHLVLLGTAAGPIPMQGRKGIASALVVDGAVYLVDFGHGAFDQLQDSGVEIADLRSIFVTHLHSDHLADLYTLFWLRFGGIDPIARPIDVYGPGPAGALPDTTIPGTPEPTIEPGRPTPGLSDFIRSSITATAYDLNLRVRDEAWPDIRDMVRPHDIEVPDVGAGPRGNLAPPMDPFVVMQDDRVKVTAILVDHPPVYPSFAFRFDTAHGSVVFSGDTTLTDNMVTLASGAEVLVHEAIDLQVVTQFGPDLSPSQIAHLTNSHSDVTKLGALAQRAGVETLVLSHLAPGTTQWPDLAWALKAQKGFSGRVVVGRDLQRLAVKRGLL